MSTGQWILNMVLLVWVLGRNLGTRPVTRSTFVVPVVVALAAAIAFLRHVPTSGHDVQLELIGVAAGVTFGVLAGLLAPVLQRDTRVLVRAGAAFAAVWVVAIGGRVAFAEWATHSGATSVARFSMAHQITGADAWTAAFVLMALAMVLTRTAVTASRAWAVKHTLGSRLDGTGPCPGRGWPSASPVMVSQYSRPAARGQSPLP